MLAGEMEVGVRREGEVQLSREHSCRLSIAGGEGKGRKTPSTPPRPAKDWTCDAVGPGGLPTLTPRIQGISAQVGVPATAWVLIAALPPSSGRFPQARP